MHEGTTRKRERANGKQDVWKRQTVYARNVFLLRMTAISIQSVELIYYVTSHSKAPIKKKIKLKCNNNNICVTFFCISVSKMFQNANKKQIPN